MIKIYSIEEAAYLLSQGLLIALPTETVYGLGADAYNNNAVRQIFVVKSRPMTKSLIVHYSNLSMLTKDVVLNEKAKILAKHFWPGPLTLILEKKSSSQLSDYVSSTSTIAVRIPNHTKIISVIDALKRPIAAPSANRFGHISPTLPSHVYDSIGDKVNYIFNDGPARHGIESTIIDCRKNPIILRLGVVSMLEIENVLGEKVQLQENIFTPGSGQHYMPLKPVHINVKAVDKKDALLAFGKPFQQACYVFNLSYNKNLQEAANKLFAGLYILDQSNCDRICVMSIPKSKIGMAINDRLYRMSSNISE